MNHDNQIVNFISKQPAPTFSIETFRIPDVNVAWIPIWQMAEPDKSKYLKCQVPATRKFDHNDDNSTMIIIFQRPDKTIEMYGACEICWRMIDNAVQEDNGHCDKSSDGYHSWRLPIEKFIKEEKADGHSD